MNITKISITNVMNVISIINLMHITIDNVINI